MSSHSPCPERYKEFRMSFMWQQMESSKSLETGSLCGAKGKGGFPTYITAASILAGVAATLVDLYLASVPTEAFLARTRVTALASVGACCSVHAGLVVGAEVKVLVTEEAAPALLAVALPRLATGPMHTARVADALIAGRTLPARATFALSRLFTVPMALTAA